MNRNEFLEALVKALVEKGREPHKHRCEKDGTIWEHSRPPEEAPSEVWRQQHLCPTCGTEQRIKYREPVKEAA